MNPHFVAAPASARSELRGDDATPSRMSVCC